MKQLIYVLLISQICLAQNAKTDSLAGLLKTDKEDTNKVKHLYNDFDQNYIVD